MALSPHSAGVRSESHPAPPHRGHPPVEIGLPHQPPATVEGRQLVAEAAHDHICRACFFDTIDDHSCGFADFDILIWRFGQR